MSIFGKLVDTSRRRSPWLFHCNTGGCNGCDIEIVACLGPRYDIEHLGALLQGSPRHADILCVTGPVTLGTEPALKAIYGQMSEPKVVVAIGSCPASCDVFAGSPIIVGPLERILPVDVYVPGCPPRPNAIIEGVVQAVTIMAEKYSDRCIKEA